MNKKLIIIMAVLTTAISVVGIIIWLSRPVSTKVNTGLAGSPSAIVEEPTAIDTTYFYTLLPPGFKIIFRQEHESGPQLIQISTTLENNNAGQLSITVGNLPSEGLPGLSDYIYRTKNQAIYKNAQFEDLPAQTTTFFSNNGDNEITVFWPHAQMYAMVSVSGSATQKNVLNNGLQSVFNQWRWK